jgi:hypothetical protein
MVSIITMFIQQIIHVIYKIGREKDIQKCNIFNGFRVYLNFKYIRRKRINRKLARGLSFARRTEMTDEQMNYARTQEIDV